VILRPYCIYCCRWRICVKDASIVRRDELASASFRAFSISSRAKERKRYRERKSRYSLVIHGCPKLLDYSARRDGNARRLRSAPQIRCRERFYRLQNDLGSSSPRSPASTSHHFDDAQTLRDTFVSMAFHFARLILIGRSPESRGESRGAARTRSRDRSSSPARAATRSKPVVRAGV